MDNQPVGHHLKVRGIPLRSDNSPHRRPPAVISMATHHNSARPLTHPRTTNDSVVAACYPGNRFGLGVLGRTLTRGCDSERADPACQGDRRHTGGEVFDLRGRGRKSVVQDPSETLG